MASVESHSSYLPLLSLAPDKKDIIPCRLWQGFTPKGMMMNELNAWSYTNEIAIIEHVLSRYHQVHRYQP